MQRLINRLNQVWILACLLLVIVSGCSDSSDNSPAEMVVVPLQPPAEDPSIAGTWAVGHQRLEVIDAVRENRVLPYDVWYPVDAADTAAEPVTIYPLQGGAGLSSELAVDDLVVSRAGNLSLLIFSHGSGGTNTQSTPLMETLASHGFVVVSPEHTGNTASGPRDPFEVIRANRVPDISFMIDTFLARNETQADDFSERLNPDSIGVIGHSLGGSTTLGSVAGFGGVDPDDRVKAVFPISAVVEGALTAEALAQVSEPVFLLGGTLDESVPITNNDFAYDFLVNAPTLYQADIIGATHTHFANICAIGNWLIGVGLGPELWPSIGAAALIGPYNEACSEDVFPITEVVRLQNLYAVSFFRRHLRDETGYEYYLQQQYSDDNEADVSFRRQP